MNIDDTKNNTNTVNLDVLINGLTSDIKSVNNFMADLNKEKKANKEIEETIIKERKKLEHDKKEFDNYVRLMNSEFETARKTQELNFNTQKLNLAKAENSFKENMDNTLAKLELVKKELDLKEKKIEEDRQQFDKYKEIEQERLKHEREVLQFEREQFNSFKEVNNKRIEVEKRDLEQQFNKFKQIIDQFNLNFKTSLENKNEEE